MLRISAWCQTPGSSQLKAGCRFIISTLQASIKKNLEMLKFHSQGTSKWLLVKKKKTCSKPFSFLWKFHAKDRNLSLTACENARLLIPLSYVWIGKCWLFRPTTECIHQSLQLHFACAEQTFISIITTTGLREGVVFVHSHPRKHQLIRRVDAWSIPSAFHST